MAERGVRCLASPAVEVGIRQDGSLQLKLEGGMTHEFDVMYAAFGSKPRSKLALSLGAQQDAAGNLVVDAHCRTSVKWLYAAGDVVSSLAQLAVAVGHGAIAATAIHSLC